MSLNNGKFSVMHHPSSNNTILRFRIAALLLFGNYLLALVAVGLLIPSLIAYNRQWIMVGLSLVILSLTFVVAQWMAASRSGCPLCSTPVLSPRSCVKHRRSRTALGSYRLRVALAILFKNRFRCPYCNETTALEIRERVRYENDR